MDPISLLEQLIRIDSRNPFLAFGPPPGSDGEWRLEGNEGRLAEFTEPLLRAAGFQVSRQPVHVDPTGRTHHNILAEKGDHGPAILFYGHLDTVSARPWLNANEALAPRRETRQLDGQPREVVVGLGANDMKAGLAILLTAFSGLTPQGWKIKVAFGVDEEFYSLGGWALARSPFLDDVRAVVIPETGDGPNGAAGPSAIGLGRNGRCEVLVNLTGVGGHGAQAHNPALISAADLAARVAGRFEAVRRTYSDRFTFCRAGQPDAAAARETLGSLYVSRVEAGDGTLSIPASGEVVLSVQMTPAVRAADRLALVRTEVERLVATGDLPVATVSGIPRPPDVRFRSRPTPFNDPFLTPEDHPFVTYARGILEETVGFRCYNVGDSNADENLFAMARPGLPILNICPRGDCCHRAGEWVDTTSVRQLVVVYRALAERFGRYIAGTAG